MAMSSTQIMLYIIPAVKSILMGVLAIGIFGGLAYYKFIVLRRKLWFANIWEKKADGRLHLIDKDKIYEKKINKGKQTIYLMKKARVEVFPPSWQCTFRVQNKEFADYLRIQSGFVPMKKTLKSVIPEGVEKQSYLKSLRGKIVNMRNLSKKEIEDRYLFLPVNNTISAEISYKTIDYDVDMMRINSLDNRQKMYADKADFWEKYGTFLSIGAIVVLIIVVLYLSYDYSGNVLQMAFAESSKTAGLIEGLANKMGSAPPIN